MTSPRLAIAVLVTVLLVLWAHPVAAQGWEDMVWSRVKSLLVLSGLAFVLSQGVAIYLFASLLRLEGGFVAALLALVLSVVLSVVAAIPVAVVAAFMPVLISQLLVTAGSFAAGGLAVKWTFSTSFGHGVLVYVLASTATLIVTCLGLILIL
jgi:hypothetical protein